MNTNRSAVQWVKVAWLAQLSALRGYRSAALRVAATAALSAIDNDDPVRLVVELRAIEAASAEAPTRDLARGAADAVERAMQENARD